MTGRVHYDWPWFRNIAAKIIKIRVHPKDEIRNSLGALTCGEIEIHGPLRQAIARHKSNLEDGICEG